MQHHIQPRATERIVHGMPGETGAAAPELDQFIDMGSQHVVAKHPVEIVRQMSLAVRVEHIQRAPVDFQHLDLGGAGSDAAEIFEQEFLEICDTISPPGFQLFAQRLVVFEPERGGRHLEHVGVIGDSGAEIFRRLVKWGHDLPEWDTERTQNRPHSQADWQARPATGLGRVANCWHGE